MAKSQKYTFDPPRQTAPTAIGSEAQLPRAVDKGLLSEGKSSLVLDQTAPIDTPLYKIGWGCSYAVRITSTTETIDLNKIGLLKTISKKLLNPATLTDVEIHLLWISFLPSNLVRGSVTLGLEFTQMQDYEASEMQVCTFPGHQPTHCILYPGHAIHLRSMIIPWAITVDCSEIPVKEEYVLAKLYIKITGFSGEVPRYIRESDPKIIAMVPLDEPAIGVTYTRPRAATSTYRLGFVQRAIQSKDDQRKILALQAIGVDTEGLALLKKLHTILRQIKMSDLKTLGDETSKHWIARLIRQNLSKK